MTIPNMMSIITNRFLIKSYLCLKLQKVRSSIWSKCLWKLIKLGCSANSIVGVWVSLFCCIYFGVDLSFYYIYSIDQDESQSTPALLTRICSTLSNSVLSLGIIPESSIIETGARLSVSLEGPDLYSTTAGKSPLAASSSNSSSLDMNLDELRAVNRYAESTKSLSFLPQVRW